MNEPLAKIIKDISLKFNDINKQKQLAHEFLFDITSVCNLNCTNCSVFCGLREPYFITLENFSQQLFNLKNKLQQIEKDNNIKILFAIEIANC